MSSIPQKPVRVDVENPSFGALLLALKQTHKALPEAVRKRWMQAIIAAASRPYS